MARTIATGRTLAIAPNFSSASINSAGTQLSLVFDTAVVPVNYTVPLVVDGANAAAVYTSGTGTTTLVYNISGGNPSGNPVLSGAVVTVNVPWNTVANSSGIGNIAVSGQSVTNGSTVQYPSQLNPAVWLTGGTSYFFKDAAATQPCSDGDLIYTWLDRSGNNRKPIQATSANRPVATLSGGRWWSKTTQGSSQYVANSWCPTTPNCELFYRINWSNQGASGIDEIIFGGGGTNSFATGKRASGSDAITVIREGVGGPANSSPTLAANTVGVLCVRGSGNAESDYHWNVTNWNGYISKDGGSETNVTLSFAYNTTQTTRFGSNYADVLLSDYIEIDGTLSSADRTRLIAWLLAN